MTTPTATLDVLESEEDSNQAQPSTVGKELHVEMCPRTLKQRALYGSFVIIAGYGTSQILRFCSNLILTRILFPEAFGLMALVVVVNQGLAMFSDVGIGPALIRHPRGNSPEFYNTAWTIQVLRGCGLWLVACLLSPLIASFYGQPILQNLVCVSAFSAVLSGLNSTRLLALNREIRLGWTIGLDLFCQAVSIAATLFLAWHTESVWSLMVGGLIGATLKTILSHVVVPGPSNRFHWNRESSTELFSFGKWVFVATLMGFCASQLDRILLGRLLPLALFGAFFIAYSLTDVIRYVMTTLSGTVFLPAYSQELLSRNKTFGESTAWLRKVFLVGTGVVIALLIAFGDQIIYLLYDARYAPAAKLVPILALGLWPRALFCSTGPGLMALGKSGYGAIANLLRLVVVGGSMLLAYQYLHVEELIIVVALADLPQLLVVEYGLHREGLTCRKLNLVATLWMVAWVCGLLLVRNALGIEPIPLPFG